MVKIYRFHGSSNQRLCGSSLLYFLASFSILPLGGARQATPALLVALGLGAWLMGSDTGLFLLSGAEEAMATYDVCFSDNLRWQENVFVTSCSVGKIGWSWSFCSSIQRSMSNIETAILLKV